MIQVKNIQLLEICGDENLVVSVFCSNFAAEIKINPNYEECIYDYWMDGAAGADDCGDGVEQLQRNADGDDPKRVLAKSRYQRSYPNKDHRELRWDEKVGLNRQK